MYMRFKQYRIPQYRKAKKQELVKINITQDDKCSYCGEVEGTSSIQSSIHLGFDNYTPYAKYIILGELRRK